MSGDLVLITGGSGLVGIKTIQLALQAGFSVRAAIRSQSKASAILATPTVSKLVASGASLSFVVVPDILADKAYDDAVKGVKYILHIASPVIKGEDIAPENWERDLIQPAIRGTLAILTAAHKTPGIQRIVITSSVVAVIPWEDIVLHESPTVYTAQNNIPNPQGPFKSSFEAYAASKVRALHASDAFVKEHNPVWDVVNILPAFVIGDNEMVTRPEDVAVGTVGAAFVQVLGGDSGWGTVGSTSVHVADVGLLHVQALDIQKIRGNERFLAISGGEKGTRWEDAREVVARRFPKAVASGVLKNDGTASTKRVRFDASRTEEVFGWKFKSYEEQVVSVAEQYLGLVGETVG